MEYRGLHTGNAGNNFSLFLHYAALSTPAFLYAAICTPAFGVSRVPANLFFRYLYSTFRKRLVSFVLQWTLCTSFSPRNHPKKVADVGWPTLKIPALCFSQGRLTKFKCSNFIPVSKSPIIFFVLLSCPLWLLLIYQSTLPPFFLTVLFGYFEVRFFSIAP